MSKWKLGFCWVYKSQYWRHFGSRIMPNLGSQRACVFFRLETTKHWLQWFKIHIMQSHVWSANENFENFQLAWWYCLWSTLWRRPKYHYSKNTTIKLCCWKRAVKRYESKEKTENAGSERILQKVLRCILR